MESLYLSSWYIVCTEEAKTYQEKQIMSWIELSKFFVFLRHHKQLSLATLILGKYNILWLLYFFQIINCSFISENYLIKWDSCSIELIQSYKRPKYMFNCSKKSCRQWHPVTYRYNSQQFFNKSRILWILMLYFNISNRIWLIWVLEWLFTAKLGVKNFWFYLFHTDRPQQ